jgi:hemoglobin-like flavoprotein
VETIKANARTSQPFERWLVNRMTPAQLRLLQRSFSKIEPLADEFGAMFYERLFIIAPDIKPMFRTDLKAQQSKFMKVIGEVVQLHLRAIISLPVTAQASGEVTLPGAFWSGKLHAAYGVRMEDFERMKEALIWALERALGSDMSPEIRDAWHTAYDIVVRSMQTGMTSDEDDEREPNNELQQRLNTADEEEGGAAFLKMLGNK